MPVTERDPSIQNDAHVQAPSRDLQAVPDPAARQNPTDGWHVPEWDDVFWWVTAALDDQEFPHWVEAPAIDLRRVSP